MFSALGETFSLPELGCRVLPLSAGAVGEYSADSPVQKALDKKPVNTSEGQKMPSQEARARRAADGWISLRRC